MRTYIVSFVAVTWLTSCASVIPENIRTESPGNIQVAQVRDQPQQFHNVVVRWGGHIINTRNEREHTVLEVIGRDLDNEGRPREEDTNLGRFLVKVQGFLDPAIYKPEREVTVHGRIQDVIEQSIGEYRYRYPVVQADDIYLWKPPLPSEPRYRYYDPFPYDPWHLPRPWPYYYP